MAFKLNTYTNAKNYGKVANEDIREVSVFCFDRNGSVTVRIVLNDGSEIAVSSDGGKKVIEWDSAKGEAKVETLDLAKMAELVVKV